MRVNTNFNINSHSYLTQLASIGDVILIYIPKDKLTNLHDDSNIESFKVEKFLKTYFKVRKKVGGSTQVLNYTSI